MNNSIKVSVIMPSLNVANYIEECIQSVLAQTLTELEILCVDAGSTDGTLEILERYANVDSRIQILHSGKKSYGYQVNWGIKEARGEYVAILETDDYIEKEMYECLYNKAVEIVADVVKADFDAFITLSNGKKFFNPFRMWHDGAEKYNRIINGKDIDLYLRDCSIWKGIYRKEFLQKYDIRLNETSGAAYQDIGFVQQTLAYAKQIVYMDKSFYRYRMDRDESSSFSPNILRYVRQEFEWLMEMPFFLENHPNLEGFYSRLANCLILELPKVLRTLDYEISSDYVQPHYRWIRDVLLRFSNELGEDRIFKNASYELCLSDLETYSKQICSEDKKNNESHRLILQKLEGKKVIVFGTGGYGKNAIMFLLNNNVKIVSLIDNDEALWKKEIYGIGVMSPSECINVYHEDYYVIANKTHADVMRKQLLQLGIQEYQIAMWD